MISKIEKICKNNTENDEFSKEYYMNREDNLSYSDNVEASIQHFFEVPPCPAELCYDADLEQLDFLLKDEEWVNPNLRNNKRLWEGILAEASFLIECSLDLYENGDE